MRACVCVFVQQHLVVYVVGFVVCPSAYVRMPVFVQNPSGHRFMCSRLHVSAPPLQRSPQSASVFGQRRAPPALARGEWQKPQCTRNMSSSGSEDGDCVGGSAPCEPQPKKVAHRAASSTKVRLLGRQRDTGSSSARLAATDAIDSATCILCEDGTGLTDLRYRGFLIHQSCRNAVRAHARLLGSQPAKKNESDRLFWADVASWRTQVGPLVAPPGQKRTPAQRSEVRAAAATKEEYRTVETIQDSWRAPLQQYIAYRCLWDRLTEDEAQDAFDDAVQEQGSDCENSDGEPTVLIEERPRQRVITGTRSGTRMAGIGPSEARGSVRAGSECSDPMWSVSKRRRRDASPAAQADMHDDDDDDDGGDGARTPHPKPPKSKVRKLTADALRAHGTKRAACATESVSPQVMLLRHRTDLVRDVKAFATEVFGPKNPYKLLQKKITGVTQETMDVLGIKPTEALASIKETLISPLEALQQSMTKLHLGDVMAKKVGSTHEAIPST